VISRLREWVIYEMPLWYLLVGAVFAGIAVGALIGWLARP
jgi:hypothetical protein